MHSSSIEQLFEQKGFPLLFVFSTQSDLAQTTLKQNTTQPEQYNSLILIAHAGQSLWPHFTEHQKNHPKSFNPIDDYSIQSSTEILATLGDQNPLFLYPNTNVSLFPFLEQTGWGFSSPVGILIHPQFGLWWAIRSFIATKLILTPSQALSDIHPCTLCVEKPCLSSCPVQATQISGLDFKLCSETRLKESSCGNDCAARLACPIGQNFTYSEEQRRYHNGRSLKMIQQLAAEK